MNLNDLFSTKLFDVENTSHADNELRRFVNYFTIVDNRTFFDFCKYLAKLIEKQSDILIKGYTDPYRFDYSNGMSTTVCLCFIDGSIIEYDLHLYSNGDNLEDKFIEITKIKVERCVNIDYETIQTKTTLKMVRFLGPYGSKESEYFYNMFCDD